MIEKKPPRILAVEDDAIFGESLREGFEQLGWHTEVAPTGTIGFERAADWKPDLILLDIVLPDLTGYELLSRLKSNPPTSQIPVIILSSLEDAEDIQRGKELGAVDFLSKGKHDFSFIVARIKKFFANGS